MGDKDSPAFPFKCQGPTTGPEFYYGLTKREYYAAKAMQALAPVFIGSASNSNAVAQMAFTLADAMIAEATHE